MTDEIWVLGATGRTGRAIASALTATGREPVLVGRNAAALDALARDLPGPAHTLVAADVAAMARAIADRAPAVVVNTVGPFGETAGVVARACLAGSHYLDLANDAGSALTILGLDTEAVTAGRTFVTGAGFGVAATESVVVAMCAGRPTPRRVRTDMVPSLAIEAGPVGDALAASMVEGLPGAPGGGRFQGRRYRGGRLVAARIGGGARRLTLPDGTEVTTTAVPFGELIAAQRASGAPDVVAASSELPGSPVARVVLPIATRLLAIAPLRRTVRRRLGATQMQARPRPRTHSWGHAEIEDADGSRRDGWLRVGDASEFTTAVAVAVATRLADGEGRPGAFTPVALFGRTLAESCGGVYVDV